MRADKQGSSSHTLLYQQREAHICRVSPTESFFPFPESGSSSSLSRSCPVQVQPGPTPCSVLSALRQLRLVQGDLSCITWLCCSTCDPPPAKAELSIPQSRVFQGWKGSLCATLPSSHGSNAEEHCELRADKLIWQSTILCFPKCSQARAHCELFTLLHP